MLRRSASSATPEQSQHADIEQPLTKRRRKRVKIRRNASKRGILLSIPLLLMVVTFVTISVKFLLKVTRKRPKRAAYPPLYPKITRNGAVLSKEALDMCTRALWHTLETTTIVLPDAESFIHTGDIDDLWLRDSAAQVHPLVTPTFNDKALVAQDAKLNRIVAGLIKRTAMYIRHDPWANAFRIDDSYVFSEAQKKMGRHDLISTWNYELDSGCYYMRLLYYYWRESNNHDVLKLQAVHEAVLIMVDLWIAEQQHEDDVVATGPLFDCLNCNKPYRYPGLKRDGKGSATNSSSGLTWTAFRPSDDECTYGFLVPANMFAVVVLEYVVEMATVLWEDKALAMKAEKLAADIEKGIQEHAIVKGPDGNLIYAYEVDGLGNALLMDDANVPSLLSIPYLGYKYDDDIYTNTRKFILSDKNPTFRRGTNALTGDVEGYGSPHMASRIKDNIWPMAMAMQGLTSDNEEEKIRIVEQLVKASAGTGWMHESFSVKNPNVYTRSWFCWADSLFGKCLCWLFVHVECKIVIMMDCSCTVPFFLAIDMYSFTAELVLSLTDECPSPEHKYDVLEWRDLNVVPGGYFALD
jgi:meiotically up-regulated gene 157 (Mug157) protein